MHELMLMDRVVLVRIERGGQQRTANWTSLSIILSINSAELGRSETDCLDIRREKVLLRR